MRFQKHFSRVPPLRLHRCVAQCLGQVPGLVPSVLLPLARTQAEWRILCLRVSLTHYKLMSTPAFLAAAVVLGLAGAFALIKHRSKKTIPRLPDAKLD